MRRGSHEADVWRWESVVHHLAFITVVFLRGREQPNNLFVLKNGNFRLDVGNADCVLCMVQAFLAVAVCCAHSWFRAICPLGE